MPAIIAPAAVASVKICGICVPGPAFATVMELQCARASAGNTRETLSASVRSVEKTAGQSADETLGHGPSPRFNSPHFCDPRACSTFSDLTALPRATDSHPAARCQSVLSYTASRRDQHARHFKPSPKTMRGTETPSVRQVLPMEWHDVQLSNTVTAAMWQPILPCSSQYRYMGSSLPGR